MVGWRVQSGSHHPLPLLSRGGEPFSEQGRDRCLGGGDQGSDLSGTGPVNGQGHGQAEILLDGARVHNEPLGMISDRLKKLPAITATATVHRLAPDQNANRSF